MPYEPWRKIDPCIATMPREKERERETERERESNTTEALLPPQASFRNDNPTAAAATLTVIITRDRNYGVTPKIEHRHGFPDGVDGGATCSALTKTNQKVSRGEGRRFTFPGSTTQRHRIFFLSSSATKPLTAVRSTINVYWSSMAADLAQLLIQRINQPTNQWINHFNNSTTQSINIESCLLYIYMMLRQHTSPRTKKTHTHTKILLSYSVLETTLQSYSQNPRRPQVPDW